MKLPKKQPSRDDLARALLTVHGQSQIIKLQGEEIHHLEKLVRIMLLIYPRFQALRVN